MAPATFGHYARSHVLGLLLLVWRLRWPLPCSDFTAWICEWCWSWSILRCFRWNLGAFSEWVSLCPTWIFSSNSCQTVALWQQRRDASTGSHWHCSQVIDVRSLCRMLPSTCQVEHVLHLHPQPPPGMMLKLIHSQMFQMKPWCLQWMSFTLSHMNLRQGVIYIYIYMLLDINFVTWLNFRKINRTENLPQECFFQGPVRIPRPTLSVWHPQHFSLNEMTNPQWTQVFLSFSLVQSSWRHAKCVHTGDEW